MFDNHDPHDPMIALNILVIDNDEEERNNTLSVIRESGHIGDGIASGTDAIGALYKTPYDLVMIEQDLHSVPGTEIVKIIKSLPEGKGRLPILCLTNNREKEDVRRCFEAGMNNFLLKPLTTSSLNAAVIAYAFKKRKTSLASGDSS